MYPTGPGEEDAIPSAIPPKKRVAGRGIRQARTIEREHFAPPHWHVQRLLVYERVRSPVTPPRT